MEEDLEPMAGGHGVSVHSGFPNPAGQQLARHTPLNLDINRLLVRNPSSTYLFRVSGHHWADNGVFDGDVAVIDRRLTPRPADLVIAWQASGFVIGRFARLPQEADFWGVITATIHQLRAA